MTAHYYYHSRNFNIDIYNKLKYGRIIVDLNMHNFQGLPNCLAYFTGYHETEPIVIVQPFAKKTVLFTHIKPSCQLRVVSQLAIQRLDLLKTQAA